MDNVVDANLTTNWTTLSTMGRFETLENIYIFQPDIIHFEKCAESIYKKKQFQRRRLADKYGRGNGKSNQGTDA